MSEDQDKSSKTEEPTGKRLSDAENKGQIPKSQEINHWFMILGATMVLGLFATNMAHQIREVGLTFISQPHKIPMDFNHLVHIAKLTTGTMLSILGPVFALLMFVALAANLVQHMPVFTAEKIKPKLSKISPIKGAQKLFALRQIVEFVKGITKISIIFVVVALYVWPDRNILPQLIAVETVEIFSVLKREALIMLVATLAVMIVVALVDLIYQKFEHIKGLRMTKQEVKDEHKQVEGDPQVKARIRSLRLQRARQRMMAAVPDADVIVTNPTHFAIALEYKPEKMSAPIIVAKGVDAVAFRIRDLAEEHHIPVVENPPLARTLFATCDLGDEVPIEHYKAVAEIISYIMQLKKRWQPSAAAAR
ncbi:MAG: flagellar biosynthesis protein FlhB [Proteobacteria bacterium]|nr:flagellar biosynthesis protein FlhB [Pseudomonadota bacterium]